MILNGLPWKRTEIILLVLRLHPNTAFQTLLDEWYLLTTALPDLERVVAALGPPAPMQPLLLGHGVAPLGHACVPSQPKVK